MPRTATEAVLVQLEMALDDGARVLMLEGSPGAGKTTLLHVLAQRLDGRFQPVHLPYPKLSPRELCQWALAALNESPNGHPEVALRARIARDADMQFPPLLWMMDDAGWMPLATLRRLIDLQADYPDGLRTLLVVPDRFPAEILERHDLHCERVTLEGRMDREEMSHYVHARLERCLTDPDSRSRLEEALPQLYRQSDGNPARLHVAASGLLCRGWKAGDTQSPARATPPMQA